MLGFGMSENRKTAPVSRSESLVEVFLKVLESDLFSLNVQPNGAHLAWRWLGNGITNTGDTVQTGSHL